jgi:hypothetical protein
MHLQNVYFDKCSSPMTVLIVLQSGLIEKLESDSINYESNFFHAWYNFNLINDLKNIQW